METTNFSPGILRRRSFLGLAGGGALAAQAAPLISVRAHADDRVSTELTPTPIAIHTQKWAVIPDLATRPTIDGIVNAAEWDGAAVLDDFRLAFHDTPDPDQPTYRVGATTTHLCLAGTMPLVRRGEIGHIEILVATGPDGEDHHVVAIPINPVQPITTEWLRADVPEVTPSRHDVGQFSYATGEDASAETFTVELAIPFDEVGGAPADGEQWRLNIIHVHNVNTKPLTSWFPIATSRFRDRLSFPLTFTADVVNHGRMGSVVFGSPGSDRLRGSGTWQLTYLDFGEKQVEWHADPAGRIIPRGDADATTVHLDWKAGSHGWQRLDDVEATVSADQLLAAFTHPGPTAAGSYQLRVSTSTGRSPETVLAILSVDREALITAGIAAIGSAEPDDARTPVAAAAASAEVQELIDLVPDHAGFRFVGLPESPNLLPDSLYTFGEDRRSVVAKSTGTVYPNDRFPETQSVTAVVRDGTTAEYPYYEDDDGRRYFFTAHVWRQQRSYVLGQLVSLSERDPLGGARLLHRFAQAWRTSSPVTDQAWINVPLNADSGPPFNHWGGAWSHWYLSDLFASRPLVLACAEIKKTDAFEVLSAELGVDVEDEIVNDLILPTAEYVLSYPATMGNQDGSIMNGLAILGKSLSDPDLVHRAVEWIRNFAAVRFLADGSWYELATHYHVEAAAGLNAAINSLAGYSDPAGYVSPRTGLHLADLDLRREFPVLDTIAAVPNILAYPDGGLLPLQDTWANMTAPAPATDLGSTLLPQSGIARLSWGTGRGSSQLYLSFIPKYGYHLHSDALSITMYSRGQELVPDLGYTHSRFRWSTTCTMGHNTVVVDSVNAHGNGPAVHGGSLERFSTASAGIQIVRARQDNAWNTASLYQRELWQIDFPDDPDNGYVLDVFRVRGGNRHEYVLSGDANRDAHFETALDLTDYGPRLLPPGVVAVEAEDQHSSGNAEGHYPGYIYVKDVQQAILDGDAYELTVRTADEDGDRTSLAVIGVLDDGDNELFLGRSPSVRSARLNGPAGDTNDQVELYDLPKLVLRREGSNLSSTFITVLESHDPDRPRRVETVEQLTIDSGPSGAVAVRVVHGNVTDLLISNPAEPAQPLAVAGVAMTGELGAARWVDGELVALRLTGGTELEAEGVRLEGSGFITGRVVATTRLMAGDDADSIVLDGDVPPSVIGTHVVITDPNGNTWGHRITDVAAADGQSVLIVDQDPGFTFRPEGGTEQTSYPMLTWAVDQHHTFEVASETTWTA